jgi:phosphoglycolate phosphatase-like HAD superfamily hydrolase
VKKYLEKFVENADIIFWDFDGVIKDSVEAKSLAFEELFDDYNDEFKKRVRSHHEKNTGVSRFKKIPLYLSWSGEKVSDKKLNEFYKNFSFLVKGLVIKSPWVIGFLEFIERYFKEKKHILVTSTPTNEIEEILKELNIRHFFYKVYGSPNSKSGIINQTLIKMKVNSKNAIMIGDSASDLNAAKENNVLFFLRSTCLNKNLESECKDYIFRDFTNE